MLHAQHTATFKTGSSIPSRKDRSETAPVNHREIDNGRRRILCRACGHPVTSTSERMPMQGSHRHVFFNPHGIMFEIGCFLSAPGTIRTGPFVADFSWFPGHDWQLTACGRCETHLGWFYTKKGSGFYGLILPALIEEQT